METGQEKKDVDLPTDFFLRNFGQVLCLPYSLL